MHTGAFSYVAGVVADRGPFKRVLEIGGRDINGSVRPLFGDAAYTSLDIAPGPGVDIVADAATWKPPRTFDAVVCCEVLEHTPSAEAIVAAAGRAARRGGWVIITAACPPRAPHSATDGGALTPDEFYANIDPGDLADWLGAIGTHEITVDHQAGDVYGWAHKT